MMWTDAPCWITCWNDSNSFIKATRSPKIECIVAQQPWFENDCLFADIVLPITTKFENNDIGADSGNGQFPIITDEKRVIEPVGEAKSDYEAVCLIAEKLGLLEEYTGGQTIEEKKELVLKGSTRAAWSPTRSWSRRDTSSSRPIPIGSRRRWFFAGSTKTPRTTR